MLLDTPSVTTNARVDELNARYKRFAAIPVLRAALEDATVGKTALVSSFGAESVVLLHMASLIDRHLPVIFIDTQMLFQETLDYQLRLADHLRLTNIQRLSATDSEITATDPKDDLHQRDTDACCHMRKIVPLARALEPYDAWITGRKRFQSGTRAALELFEADTERRIKINPLARWRKKDVQDYIINNRLPRHPLVAKGYPSIGCAPLTCTRPVSKGEDERAGRWAEAEKTECGIHFGPDGVIQRKAM